jgi:DNA-binding transcriptional LysR family regulator
MPLRFDWDKLRVFRLVAEVGSFTKAAEILNIHQSALSRNIANLEHSLNASLFHRHSRGLKLTEEGQILFQTSQSIIHLLNNAEVSIANKSHKVAGEITFTSSESLGAPWLTSIINQFLQKNPSVGLRIFLTDAELDLGMREADIALRFRKAIEPNLISKYVGTIQYGLFASKDYLSNKPPLKTLNDLAEHRLITYTSKQQRFSFSIDATLHPDIKPINFSLPPLRLSTVDNIISATLEGMGIASLPLLPHTCHESFVRVLPQLTVAETSAYIVFDRDLSSYQKIQALKNHIADAFSSIEEKPSSS